MKNSNSSESTISRALSQVSEIKAALARGDETLAREARKTLNELCWSPDGYPAPVRNALDDAGLRSTTN